MEFKKPKSNYNKYFLKKKPIFWYINDKEIQEPLSNNAKIEARNLPSATCEDAGKGNARTASADIYEYLNKMVFLQQTDETIVRSYSEDRFFRVMKPYRQIRTRLIYMSKYLKFLNGFCMV